MKGAPQHAPRVSAGATLLLAVMSLLALSVSAEDLTERDRGLFKTLLLEELKFSWDIGPGGAYYPVKLLLGQKTEPDCWVLANKSVRPITQGYDFLKEIAKQTSLPNPIQFSVSTEAIEDLNRRGNTPASLDGIETWSLIEKVDDQLVQAILAQIAAGKSWKPLEDRFPGCARFLHLSLPGYSRDGSEAVIYISFSRDRRGEEGYLRSLRRDSSGNWKLADFTITKSLEPEEIVVGFDRHSRPEDTALQVRIEKELHPNIPVFARELPLPGKFLVEKGSFADLRGAISFQVWADKEDTPSVEAGLKKPLPGIVFFKPPSECARVDVHLSINSSQSNGDFRVPLLYSVHGSVAILGDSCEEVTVAQWEDEGKDRAALLKRFERALAEEYRKANLGRK